MRSGHSHRASGCTNGVIQLPRGCPIRRRRVGTRGAVEADDRVVMDRRPLLIFRDLGEGQSDVMAQATLRDAR